MTFQEQSKIRGIINNLVSSHLKGYDAPCSSETHFNSALVDLLEFYPEWRAWDTESQCVVDWAKEEISSYRKV